MKRTEKKKMLLAFLSKVLRNEELVGHLNSLGSEELAATIEEYLLPIDNKYRRMHQTDLEPAIETLNVFLDDYLESDPEERTPEEEMAAGLANMQKKKKTEGRATTEARIAAWRSRGGPVITTNSYEFIIDQWGIDVCKRKAATEEEKHVVYLEALFGVATDSGATWSVIDAECFEVFVTDKDYLAELVTVLLNQLFK